MSSVSDFHADSRYDGLTRLLHWLSALLIIALFVLALVWQSLPREQTPPLKHLHVGLGVVLAAIFLVRLVWRATAGRRLPRADAGWRGGAALALHRLFYVLIVLQLAAGFCKRWVRGREVEFFGMGIPAPFAMPEHWRSALGIFHEWNAWLIIALAVLHILAALQHHFACRDGVLRRML